MGRLAARRGAALILSAWVAVAAACSREPAAKQYTLEGQILAVDAARQQITISHGDIAGFMPAMTMTYPVATPALMQGRAAGETITATLEVREAVGTLTAITHTGEKPLPADTGTHMAVDLLVEGDEPPDAAFVDQQDKRRSFVEWRGTPTVVTFAYTTCPLPNFCPLMDQNFATIQKEAAQDPALAGRVKLVTISVDPEHDTPAVLAAHAKTRHADPAVWTFLTGDHFTVERFAARFGVGILRPEGEPGITHNLRTALIGPDFRIAKFYTGNDWTPGQVLADLRALPK